MTEQALRTRWYALHLFASRLTNKSNEWCPGNIGSHAFWQSRKSTDVIKNMDNDCWEVLLGHLIKLIIASIIKHLCFFNYSESKGLLLLLRWVNFLHLVIKLLFCFHSLYKCIYSENYMYRQSYVLTYVDSSSTLPLWTLEDEQRLALTALAEVEAPPAVIQLG